LLAQRHAQFDSLPDSLQIDTEIRFSRSALRWLHHASDGKLNPNLLYDDWDLKRTPTPVAQLLHEGLQRQQLSALLTDCHPKHPVYLKLKRALRLLKAYPDKFIGLVNLKEVIKPQQKSRYMPIIKKRLMYWGDLPEKDTLLTTTYDAKTRAAVLRFQKRHGLRPDGIIARATIDALNYSRDQRIEQIVVNMERWRWYPNDLGAHYLLINIPDYTLVAVKANDTVQRQRVVVGRDSRRTPILTSKITNLNLNPNWTVPPTILKEDIFPEAEKNPYFFRKKGLQIIDRNNQEVAPELWRLEDAFKYKYVQNPGRNNSLGLMKINFPNRYTVYLHDTNHRDYFSLSFRSLSSGCVRLERPLEMAAHLLNDTKQWPLQKIKDTTNIKHYQKLREAKIKALEKKQALVKAKNPKAKPVPIQLPKAELKTIVLKIKDDIRVHQFYWTAWEENGTLQFREDIYCLDSDLYTLLRYKS
ncbi:murein L,D-transpeptidase, partial [Flavobacterium sp.]